MEQTKPGILGLTKATTSWEATTGFVRQRVHREGYSFEDWTIDGVPVRQLLQGHDLGHVQKEATYLTDGSEESVRQIDRLLTWDSAGDFGDRRVALLICPIDGDLNCGAITVRVIRHADTVEWSDFGWQNGQLEDFSMSEPPLTLIFDRSSYDDVLTEAGDRYSQ